MAPKRFHIATASLETKDNAAKQSPFDGRTEQVKFSGRNYFASSSFGRNLYLYISMGIV